LPTLTITYSINSMRLKAGTVKVEGS